jgi:hypothetical protein
MRGEDEEEEEEEEGQHKGVLLPLAVSGIYLRGPTSLPQ